MLKKTWSLMIKCIAYILFYFIKFLVIGGVVIMIANTVIRADFTYSLWEILTIGLATDVVIHMGGMKIDFK